MFKSSSAQCLALGRSSERSTLLLGETGPFLGDMHMQREPCPWSEDAPTYLFLRNKVTGSLPWGCGGTISPFQKVVTGARGKVKRG